MCPNCWEDTMAGPNKKLIAAVEACFAALRIRRRDTGAQVGAWLLLVTTDIGRAVYR